jgi:hypothetical protein
MAGSPHSLGERPNRSIQGGKASWKLAPLLGFAFGKDFDGGEGGGGAAFDTHFLEADAEVLFGGFFAHFEDGGDVAVAFALA